MWMPCWSHPPAVIRCTDAPPACRWAPYSRFRGPVSPGSTTTALEDRSISLDELTRRLHAPAEDPTHIDKLALIFGTEGDGLSHHTIARADLTVKIPMSHGVDSLNVAASSAVAFYATR